MKAQENGIQKRENQGTFSTSLPLPVCIKNVNSSDSQSALCRQNPKAKNLVRIRSGIYVS